MLAWWCPNWWALVFLKCLWSECFYFIFMYIVQVFQSQIAYLFSWWKSSLHCVFDDFRLLHTAKNRGQSHAIVTSQDLQTFRVHILAICFSRRRGPWERRTLECCTHCHWTTTRPLYRLQWLYASMFSLLPGTSSSAKFGEHNKLCTLRFSGGRCE